MNPDGTTQVANWYMQHVGTPYEKAPLPELYHRYIGHDNNRDWFMLTQPESQAVARQLYHVWFPQIVHNQHQEAPFPARIFVPPFEDPVNPHIPPLVVRGINTVGDAITRRLEQEGKVGAVSRLQFDTWWNGGMRTAPYFHNMIGILTETAHASASPDDVRRALVPAHASRQACRPASRACSTRRPIAAAGGHSATAASTCSPPRWPWSISRSRRREEWLYDIYQMGRDQVGGRPLGDVSHPGRPVGSSDGRGDDQHAAPRRCGDRAIARRLRDQRADVPRRHLCDSRRAAVPRLSAGPAAPAALSRPAALSWGPRGPAVRHHGMDLADADGRARRRGRSLGLGAHSACGRGGPGPRRRGPRPRSRVRHRRAPQQQRPPGEPPLGLRRHGRAPGGAARHEHDAVAHRHVPRVGQRTYAPADPPRRRYRWPARARSCGPPRRAAHASSLAPRGTLSAVGRQHRRRLDALRPRAVRLCAAHVARCRHS